MRLNVPKRGSHDLNPWGLYKINAASQQHVKMTRDHGAAVAAQEHGGSIAERRSDFVAQSVIADQQRRVVDWRATVKVNGAIGNHFDFLSSRGHHDQLVWVVMENALHVGARFVDRSVHRSLAVGVSGALELVAFTVEDNQIAHCNFSRWHMRCAQNSAVRKTRGNMPVTIEQALFL